jgi:hypothetical protein
VKKSNVTTQAMRHETRKSHSICDSCLALLPSIIDLEVRIWERQDSGYKALLDVDRDYFGFLPPFEGAEVSVAKLLGLTAKNSTESKPSGIV